MRITFYAAPALLVLALAGCTNPPHTDQPTTDRPAALPTGNQPVALDPANFTADITHPYWPMRAGTRWTYREVDDGRTLTTTVIATGTTRKLANGITARVVRDTLSGDGAVIEDTLDLYAQDRAGNLWYFGENTAEFEDGKVTSRAGSFEAGVDGALPGVILPAAPTAGTRYRQEYYRGHAEDNGEILSSGEIVQVPHGLFRNAVLTKDTNPLEPDTLEYKLYARGVGPVLTLDVAGASGREELVTVDRAPAAAGTGPLGRP
jgi:hypothetical protein